MAEIIDMVLKDGVYVPVEKSTGIPRAYGETRADLDYVP